MIQTDMGVDEGEILLSICIPTFNRIGKTYALVESILTYQGNDIEVIVVDNCSTDITQEKLSIIKDTRFRYLRNKEAIGGMPNILMSLTHGYGKYVLLCLDKDRIVAENIPEFLKQLQKTDVVVGQCSLNSKEYLPNVIYNEGLESLLNIAYTSEHPSGLFIKNDILKRNPIIENIVSKYKTFAFLPELLKAEIVIHGRAGRINMPLVFTETKEECAKEISHTYKGENIYFMPANIINTFNVYLDHIYLLPLTVARKKNIVNKIYQSLLHSSVTGYKDVMADEDICMHHGIKTKEIKKRELIGNIKNFNYNFFSAKLPESVSWKFKTSFVESTKLLIKTIIN